MIAELAKSDPGRKVLSVILGLGLASLFRQVCKKGQCIVVKGPPVADVEKYLYRIDDRCYKYTVQARSCNAK